MRALNIHYVEDIPLMIVNSDIRHRMVKILQPQFNSAASNIKKL